MYRTMFGMWFVYAESHPNQTKLLTKKKIINTNSACYNLLLNRRDKVIIINRLHVGHNSLPQGYLMTNEEKLMCNTRRTELSFNHIIITECQLYVEKSRKLNITNTLDTVLRRDTDTITQVLKFFNNTKLYNSI